MKYKPGVVYILNGYGAQLTWESSNYITEVSNQNIHTNTSVEEMTAIIEGGDPFGEPVANLMIPQYDGKGLPKISLGDYLSPVPQHYYFILIDNSGLSEKKREAVEMEVKVQDNKVVKSCHLKGQNYLRRTEFKDWYSSHSEEDKEILKGLSKSPWMLKNIKEGKIDLIDMITEKVENRSDYACYFDTLGKRESLKQWKEIPASLAYKFFINKDMSKAGGYLALAGGILHPKNSDPHREWLKDTPSLQEYKGELKLANGTSSAVWHYFTKFKDKFDTNLNHSYLLRLFALWVYISNTALNHKNQDIFKKYGKFYNFYPSNDALDLIEQDMLK